MFGSTRNCRSLQQGTSKQRQNRGRRTAVLRSVCRVHGHSIVWIKYQTAALWSVWREKSSSIILSSPIPLQILSTATVSWPGKWQPNWNISCVFYESWHTVWPQPDIEDKNLQNWILPLDNNIFISCQSSLQNIHSLKIALNFFSFFLKALVIVHISVSKCKITQNKEYHYTNNIFLFLFFLFHNIT